MLDVPPPSNHSKGSSNTVEMPLMIDCTTSLENSSIRTQDNFVFTSFINYLITNKKTSTSTSISSNKRFYDDIIPSYGETIEKKYK
ncbi:unnamed protein product [Rhizophagus irregularis]|nr:unnamed protein product [Rhizophagus irregularis]